VLPQAIMMIVPAKAACADNDNYFLFSTPILRLTTIERIEKLLNAWMPCEFPTRS